MRIVDPFKVTRFIKSESDSHIDINAKVLLFEGGGGLPRTSFFTSQKIGGYQQPTFIPLEISVKWGKTDRIRIEIDTIYKFDHGLILSNALRGTGSGRLHRFEEWTITYPEEGLLVDHLKSSPGTGIIKHEGSLALAASYSTSQSPQGIEGPFIAIDAELAISKPEESGTPIAVGVDAKVINISTEIELGGSPNQSRSVSYGLKAFLSVIGRPKVTSPKPKEIPEFLLSHEVLFEKEKQKDLGTHQYELLKGWFSELCKQSPNLYKAIKEGKCQIWLSGYASTPGKEGYNKNLSNDRIGIVEKALKILFKSESLKVVRIPLGEESATLEGAVTLEKRVEIQIQQWEAIMAMV